MYKNLIKQDQPPFVHLNYSGLGSTTTSKKQEQIVLCRLVEADNCITLSTPVSEEAIMGVN